MPKPPVIMIPASGVSNTRLYSSDSNELLIDLKYYKERDRLE